MYCSNLPHGFSTLREGGLSSKNVSSFMPEQFKLSMILLGVNHPKRIGDDSSDRFSLLVEAFVAF